MSPLPQGQLPTPLGKEDVQAPCEELSPLSSYLSSRSQEPPDSFLCSRNIPFASGVSEFSKPEPWACPNKSLPLPTPQPPSSSPSALGLVPPRISSPCLGCETLPREIWPRSAAVRWQGFTPRPWGHQERVSQTPLRLLSPSLSISLNQAHLCSLPAQGSTLRVSQVLALMNAPSLGHIPQGPGSKGSKHLVPSSLHLRALL